MNIWTSVVQQISTPTQPWVEPVKKRKAKDKCVVCGDVFVPRNGCAVTCGARKCKIEREKERERTRRAA